jgi:hypothetical protein
VKHDTIAQLRAARQRAKSKGAEQVKAVLTPKRMAHLRAVHRLGAAARRAQGDATLQRLLELAEQGLSLKQVMAATGLSENGVRMCLRRKLGSGAWPPANTGEIR